MVLKIAIIGLMSCILVGCKMFPVRHLAQSPAVSISSSGAVELKGDSPNPAKVSTGTTETKLNLPEGSKIDFNERLGTLAITLAKASDIALKRTETTVAGPVAFTPDKAPTIAEEKDAQGDYWVKIGLYASVFVGGGAAVFGLVRNWNLVMYGGIATLGAGLFGIFVQKHPLILLVIGLGIALKLAGPLIWHTQLKNGQSTGSANES